MSLQSIYESSEQIPDGVKDHYKEQSDGSYKLQLEGGVKTQGDIEKIKKTLEKEREERISLQQKLSSFPDDFDPDKWDKLKHIDPENYNGDGKNETQIRNEVIDEYKPKIKELENKLQQKEEKFKNTLKRDAVQQALIEAGVTNKIRLEDATDRIMRSRDIEVREDEENGTYNVLAGSLRDPVDEFVKEWANTEEGKYYVSAGNNSGGGSNNNGPSDSNTGENPWADGSINYTKQAKIIRENPQKAEKLASEAGKTLQLSQQ